MKGKWTTCEGLNNTLSICRSPPQFSPDVWSMYMKITNNLPMTQNFIEAWHMYRIGADKKADDQKYSG